MRQTHDKIFFDFWPMIDNPQKFPFFSVLIDDGELLLIKNLLARNIDDFIWISKKDIDFSTITLFSKTEKIIIEYSEGEYDSKYILNLPPEYKVTAIESAVIYENNQQKENTIIENKEYAARKALPEDFKCLTDVYDPTMRHQYIQQIYDAFNETSCEVYVLEHMRRPVCFLVVEDSICEKLGYRYKHISNIFTIPEYRYHGFASYLVKSILNLHTKDCFLYVADSLSNDASNRLAKASGFSVIGYNRQVEIRK